MAKKDLSTQTMVTLSQAWLDSEGTRPELEKKPLTKALIPEIRTAHDTLLEMHRATERRELRLGQLVEELIAGDAVHDRKARALFGLLDALAEASDDAAAAKRFRAVQAMLFPRGLRVVNYSYEDEAGEAMLVRQRLGEADRALLDQTTVAADTLGGVFQAWMDASDALGRMVRERGQIGAGAKQEGVAPIDVLNARRGWIRAASALEQVLELMQADEETWAMVVGPLQVASEKAAQARDAKPVEPTEPETTDGGEAQPTEPDSESESNGGGDS